MTTTMNAHVVDAPGSDNQATVNLHIDNPDAIGGGSSSVTVDTLTGATDTGKALMKASDEAAARNAIGAGEQYTLPAASTSAIGGVKKAAAVAAVAAADSVAAAAETVTKAEFDAVVAEANETKQKLNALIAAGKAAGWLA